MIKFENDREGRDRRKQDKVEKKLARDARLGVGLGIGTPTAAILAWYLSLQGIHMPPGVEAAMGSVVTAAIVCIEDVSRTLRYMVIAVFEKWMRKKT